MPDWGYIIICWILFIIIICLNIIYYYYLFEYDLLLLFGWILFITAQCFVCLTEAEFDDLIVSLRNDLSDLLEVHESQDKLAADRELEVDIDDDDFALVS